MRKLFPIFYLPLLFALGGCTSIVTAPIEVTSSVVGAGFHMVGAAGGAVVDTVTGGTNEDEED